MPAKLRNLFSKSAVISLYSLLVAVLPVLFEAPPGN